MAQQQKQAQQRGMMRPNALETTEAVAPVPPRPKQPVLPKNRPPLSQAYCCFSVRKGALITGVIEILLSLTFIGISTMLREDFQRANTFKDWPHLMQVCSIWIPVDRTLVILSSIFMIIGTVHYDRLLFTPYLLWCAINVVVNTIICVLLANVVGQIIYLVWVIVCFEFYSLFIVYSEFKAIPFKLKTLQEYLDSLQAHANSGARVVPRTFGGEDEEVDVPILESQIPNEKSNLSKPSGKSSSKTKSSVKTKSSGKSKSSTRSKSTTVLPPQ